MCVPCAKLFPWRAVNRKVGAEHSPGISLGVGFTRESHWHRAAEAEKGKQTWPLFPRGHTMQILSMLVLDTDFGLCLFPTHFQKTASLAFYVHVLDPDAHSLFLKGPTGSAYVSQTRSWGTQILNLSGLWTQTTTRADGRRAPQPPAGPATWRPQGLAPALT